ELAENWGEIEERVKDGVTFHLKYLGSTLVEELENDDDSYGDSISTEAIRTIVAMAKASGKKLSKMAVTVSPHGIQVVDMLTKEVKTDLSIYRISFCTADKNYEKIFGYIARNTDNETMECHAFLSPKKKIAEAVTLTVSEAFNIAK
ncbi:Low density lipoprotein receptor adapter protein 1-A, partial [Lamellibrachia satsuma]